MSRNKRICFSMRDSLYQIVAVMILSQVLSNVARADAVWEDIDGDSNRQLIRMTVTPADEPDPAFKYRLTLLPHELLPGNSVAFYMRSFPNGGVDKTWRFVRDEFGEEHHDWYMPGVAVSDLPAEKFVAAAVAFEGLVQNHIAPGSRRRETDWGVSFVDVRGPDVIGFLLPEIQSMRQIARAVAFQTRLAIFQHRYDDAIDLLRMNYRLGRDVATQPILVSGLVGIAICGITNGTTTDLIAAPDSPNLYWALTELPRPQVSLRDALRLEMAIGPRMFEILDDPENTQRTAEEWNAVWKRDADLLGEFGEWQTPFEKLAGGLTRRDVLAGEFSPLLLGMTNYAHARDRLIEVGYSKAKVQAMPVGQVLAIYSARAYRKVAAEWEKVAYADYQTGRTLLRKAQRVNEQLSANGNDRDREILPIATMLLPAVTAAQSAAFRIERDLDALRVMEALRMHAARNKGQWPESLDQVTCAPVPTNVATNKPFDYRLDGDTAVLTLPMSDGFQIERRYEISIAK